MEIIPVIDLKDGHAVHAVRGQRDRYVAVQGVLGSGEDPVALATAYRDELGCETCYVADLDAIAGLSLHADILRALVARETILWVDAGVSSPDQGLALADLGVAKILVGSESLRSTDQLTVLAAQIDPGRLVISVDLQDGVLRAPPGVDTPHQLVALARDVGIRDAILLDLARVGAASGPPLDLLESLRPRFLEMDFYAGGGVRHRADLEALRESGAAGTLVATAFHRGALTAADLRHHRVT